MSENEQKKNKDLSSGLTSPKTAREQKQRQEERRSNLMYGTIAVLFVIVAVICLIWKSNVIPKHAAAVSIDGEKYTAAEVNFHFQNAYQSFVNQNYNYLSMLGLDPSKDLKSQQFGEQTWHDFFLDQALTQMVNVEKLNAAAEKEDFQWTDALQAQLDTSLASVKTTASASGYTEKQYLAAIYGSTMTPKTYEEQLRRSLLAEAFMQEYTDSLTYSDDQLVESYQADPNSFDRVSYSSIRVNGAPASSDAEGNEIEVTDEMREQAMAEAKAAANDLLASWKASSSQSKETMDKLAEKNDKASATHTDAGTYTDNVLGNWLFDNSRRAGDSAVLEDKDSSCYYVVHFWDRFREEYPLVNVRHILIAPEATTLTTEDPGYEEDVAAKKAEAKKKAEKILKDWTSGKADEESFIALVKEYSADTGSVPDGGLIPEIAKDSHLVPPFLDWCFEEGRAVGDSGIVESDYGYHIMYLSSFGEPRWKAQVQDKLASDDFEVWFADIVGDTKAEQHSFGMKFVG